MISIHAPSRERQYHNQAYGLDIEFQSTLPRGSDIISRQSRRTINNFNPRSLAGATCQDGSLNTDHRISIHAPSRERQYFFIIIISLAIFQSTLPRGSDSTTTSGTLVPTLFQSTLPRGSDVSALAGHWSAKQFQSTLPRGSDGALGASTIGLLNFNPRSLAGATGLLIVGNK